MLLEGLRQPRQCQRLPGLLRRGDYLGHRRTQVQAPGTGCQEPCPVCRILHRIGKRDQLLVRVEARAEQLRQHHRRQAGRLGADDGQRLVPAAVRAVMVGTGIAGAVAHALAQVGGYIDIHQRHRCIRAIAVGLSQRMQRAAARADLLVLEHLRVRALAMGEQKASADVLGEEGAVELLNVLVELVWAGTRQGSAPAGGVAVAAMDHRQPELPLLGLAQVIVMGQSRRIVQRCHHAAQLAQPQLHLDLQEEAHVLFAAHRVERHASRLARMRHQCQQAAQPQQRIARVGMWRQAARQHRQQIVQRHGARPQALHVAQQVLEGEMTLQPPAQPTAPARIAHLLGAARGTEPQRHLGRQPGRHVVMACRVQHRHGVRRRRLGELHHGIGQVVRHRLAVLGDHGLVIQRLAEDLPGKRQQILFAVAAQRG